jgi:TetR/AcrR family transcriptional regulator of autoinduction and epiphytic fitness
VTWADTGVPVPTDRRVRRKARRVNAIMQMTARVVAERGYHNTSVEEIADRLDVAKPTIYHYFDGKEQLVFAALEGCAHYVSTALNAVANADGSPIARFRDLVRRNIQLIAVEYPEMSRLFNQPQDWPEQLASAVREWQHEHDAIYRRVMAEGIESGELYVQNASLTRACLYGAIAMIPSWVERHGGDLDLDEATELVMRLVTPAPLHEAHTGPRQAPLLPCSS